MSWKRGDHAVCIFPGPWYYTGGGSGMYAGPTPQLNQVYTVVGVPVDHLELAEFPKVAWASSKFRKVQPTSFDFRQHVKKKEPEHA